MGTFILPAKEQMIAGLPVGKLNNLERRVGVLETSGGDGSTGFSNFIVTRSGNYISSILVGSTTYTVSRTGNYISSVTNGTETLTFTRNGSNQITSGTVS